MIVTGGMGLADAVAAAHHQQHHLSHLARSHHGSGDAAAAPRRWVLGFLGFLMKMLAATFR